MSVFQSVSPLCVNGGAAGESLEHQLCPNALDEVNVTRSCRRNVVEFKCSWNAVAGLNDIAVASVYLPETREVIQMPVDSSCLRFRIDLTRNNYCNLVLQRWTGWIVYARTLIASPRRPLFYPARSVESRYVVQEASMTARERELEIVLVLSEAPRGASAVLQSINESILGRARIAGRSVTTAFSAPPYDNKDLWMACVGDENNKFLSQVCVIVR